MLMQGVIIACIYMVYGVVPSPNNVWSVRSPVGCGMVAYLGLTGVVYYRACSCCRCLPAQGAAGLCQWHALRAAAAPATTILGLSISISIILRHGHKQCFPLSRKSIVCVTDAIHRTYYHGTLWPGRIKQIMCPPRLLIFLKAQIVKIYKI